MLTFSIIKWIKTSNEAGDDIKIFLFLEISYEMLFNNFYQQVKIIIVQKIFLHLKHLSETGCIHIFKDKIFKFSNFQIFKFNF
jgi:hypothetical protein